MKVAACQPPDLRDPELALAAVRDHALRAQRLGARLVVFPEAFLTEGLLLAEVPPA
jgi:predicted amidohydrolase